MCHVMTFWEQSYKIVMELNSSYGLPSDVAMITL